MKMNKQLNPTSRTFAHTEISLLRTYLGSEEYNFSKNNSFNAYSLLTGTIILFLTVTMVIAFATGPGEFYFIVYKTLNFEYLSLVTTKHFALHNENCKKWFLVNPNIFLFPFPSILCCSYGS